MTEPQALSEAGSIEDAARWLLVTTRREITVPIIVALRERFGLSIRDAIEAMRLSDQIRRGKP